MLTVFQYGDIRRAFRDGMSIRDLARTFQHSRRKIRQILAEGQPRPYTRTQPTPAPMLGAFHSVIDAILADDENAPPKQRHTAMQVYRRLRDEHSYRGGYDSVRRYIGQQRREQRERSGGSDQAARHRSRLQPPPRSRSAALLSAAETRRRASAGAARDRSRRFPPCVTPRPRDTSKS